MLLRRCIILLSVILLLAGCATTSADLSGDGPAADPVGSRLPTLPAPAEALLKARHTSALYLDEGSGYVGSLPHSNVTVDGTSAVFSPDWGGGGSAVGDAAYAVYSFNLESLDNRILHLQDGGTDVQAEDLWIGMADFDNNRWDWQQAQDDAARTFDFTGHVSVNNDVLMALMLTGHQKYRLNAATFVRMDEVEDNDAMGTGVELSGWNFRGYTGSLGSGPNYPGTDGDTEDWWTINATYPTGNQFSTTIIIQAYVYLSEQSPFVEMTVYNSSGVEVGDSSFSFCMLQPGDDGFTSQADLPLHVKLTLNPVAEGFYAEYDLTSQLRSAPTAALTSDVTSGSLPLTVNFDASATTIADSPIAYYEWYLTYNPEDLNRVPDFITLSPLSSFTFTELGYYPAYVTAVTETGASDYAYVFINAGDIPYDERENNDYWDEANILPASSGSGWTGQLGEDPVTPAPFHGWDGGYDSDDSDYVGYELQPDEAIRYRLSQLNGNGKILMEIHGSEDQGFDQSSPHYDDVDWRQYYRDPMFNNTPYTPCLELIADSFDGVYGEYSLDWTVGKPPHDQMLTPDTSNGAAPLTVTFTPGATDDDGSIDHFVWDTNDDNISDQTSSGAIQLTFDQPGSYTVSCYPVDDDGFSTYFRATTTINVS